MLIDCKFASGIHSQATGSGKSLMALKLFGSITNKILRTMLCGYVKEKDIPKKLFLMGLLIKNNLNTKNFRFWKKNDIIDMTQFQLKNISIIKVILNG